MLEWSQEIKKLCCININIYILFSPQGKKKFNCTINNLHKSVCSVGICICPSNYSPGVFQLL